MKYPTCPHCKEKITSLIWNGLTPATQTVTFHKSDGVIEEDWESTELHFEGDYTCYYQCGSCKHNLDAAFIDDLPLPVPKTQPEALALMSPL